MHSSVHVPQIWVSSPESICGTITEPEKIIEYEQQWHADIFVPCLTKLGTEVCVDGLLILICNEVKKTTLYIFLSMAVQNPAILPVCNCWVEFSMHVLCAAWLKELLSRYIWTWHTTGMHENYSQLVRVSDVSSAPWEDAGTFCDIQHCVFNANLVVAQLLNRSESILSNRQHSRVTTIVTFYLGPTTTPHTHTSQL